MKTEPRTWYGQCSSFLFAIALLCCLTLAVAPPNLFADGCFVAPKFVWDKHQDINEPTQKAIIVHADGREELLLQVKYEGPLEEFGWLIPVPNLPTVKLGSIECFYELSKFTQKNFDPRGQYAGLSSNGAHALKDEEPLVKVIEIQTVGAYQIAILSTKDSAALESWLKENQFAFPANAAGVIDEYVKQRWYFIAVKINIKGGSLFSTSKELASGELNPLQIGFASEPCLFPLRISSLNHTPSEVQVYVLSPEPLVEKGLFERELAENYQWRTNQQMRLAGMAEHLRVLQANAPIRSARIPTNLPPLRPEPDRQLSSRSEVNMEKLVPYVSVVRKDIPFCTREIPLLKQAREWWLMKQTWTFLPEEMRDLDFTPANPVFVDALADPEGAFAAANLMRLGTSGASTLIASMQSTNPVVRAHATSVAEQMTTVSPVSRNDRQDYPNRWAPDPKLQKLLPALLNDPDPEVRLHAAIAAENSQSPVFFDRMVELLRDDYAEISEAAQGYLRWQREELPKHIPLFRQMLRDTNVNAQISGLRLLMSIDHVEIPRAELLSLFSVPRMEVAGPAVAYLRDKGIFCEEAKPLLQNSLWSARMMGLGILRMDLTNQSVELAIPLLRDPVEVIRLRAHDLLVDLTGQNLPADQPEQWEQWWKKNKATFKVNISADELRQKQSERARERRRTGNSLLP